MGVMSQSSHSALSVQTIESTANSILVITFLLSSDNVKNIVSTLNPSYSSLCADDETNPLYQKYLVLVSALAPRMRMCISDCKIHFREFNRILSRENM